MLYYNLQQLNSTVPTLLGAVVISENNSFLSSSMVERAAVNREVVGSSPTFGANS